MQNSLKSALVLIAGYAVSTGASAHTGIGSHSLMEGLSHPFGLDHLLAMLAVGVWSVSALPAGKVWQGPAAFMLVLAFSAVFGASGITIPYLEHAIALSVALFGLMLVLAAQPVPKVVGLSLIAVAAALHGLAHGAETPASGFIGYASGFLLTTSALHVCGVCAGLSIRRFVAGRRTVMLSSMGTALGLAGVYLFSQI